MDEADELAGPVGSAHQVTRERREIELGLGSLYLVGLCGEPRGPPQADRARLGTTDPSDVGTGHRIREEPKLQAPLPHSSGLPSRFEQKRQGAEVLHG
jgi:hypothetical protein